MKPEAFYYYFMRPETLVASGLILLGLKLLVYEA
jgi:hypothetical protein